jgi:hypothetical protein
MTKHESCPICKSQVVDFATFTVRGKVSAEYKRCKTCNFIHAENPNWLEGSFTDALNSLDIGSVDRCNIVADFVEVLANSLKIDNPKVLDWGGGYGLLTRILRDRGVRCSHYDPYTEPLFAENIDLQPGPKFDLIVLSEVMLHITDPVSTLTELLKLSDNIMFTAVISPPDVSPEWWYFMPDTGQHVAIFSQQTIPELGAALKVNTLSDNQFFHLVAKDQPGVLTRLLFTKRFIPFGVAALLYLKRQVMRALGKSNSLLQNDQEELINRLPWRKKQ